MKWLNNMASNYCPLILNNKLLERILLGIGFTLWLGFTNGLAFMGQSIKIKKEIT